MAAKDEKDLRDATVAPPPEESPAADPDATQLASPPADADATQLADAAENRAAETRAVDPDDLPTIVVPSAGAAATEATDGLDAMDSPYYAPATLEDLTSAQAPVTIESPVQSLPERRRRLPRWAVALLAVVLLAAAGGVAWYTYDQEVWGGKTVPPVVGKAQDEAVRALEELGFVVSVESVMADDAIGTVLGCQPPEGQRVDPAEGITLSVAAQRTVPRVVGLEVEDAQEALGEAGARSISVSYQNSDAAAGTVLSVSPAEGTPFRPEDQVSLVVARAYTVPDVLGLPLEEAKAELASGGLAASVSYERSDEQRNSVIEVEPGVGSEVEPGATVALSVATPLPSDPYDLLAYFDVIPQALPDYLDDEGFSLSYGEIYASGGNANVAYAGESGDVLRLTNDPESGHYAGGSQADVLATGAGVGGVRYAFSSKTLPEGGDVESESGVRAVMAACGLEGLLDTCTQDDIVMPEPEPRPEAPAQEGADAQGDADADAQKDDGDEKDAEKDAEEQPEPNRHFICGYGRQDDYAWAVVIGGYDNVTRVVALVAPTAHFEAVNLSSFGGSVCDYIAYIDQYTG